MRTLVLAAAVLALVGSGLATSGVTAAAQGSPPGAAEADSFEAGWNTWAEAKKGDWVEYKWSFGMVKRYEVTSVNAGNVTFKLTTIPAGGGAPVVSDSKEQPWQKVPLVSGRLPDNGEWDTEERVIGSSSLTCDKVTWVIGSTSSSNLYSKEVPCGGVVCCRTNGEERIWLIKWGKGGKEFGEGKVELPKFYKKGHKAMYSVVKKPEGKDAEAMTYKLVEVVEVGKDGRVTYTETPCDKDGKPNLAKAERFVKDAMDLTRPYLKPEERDKKIKIGKKEYKYNVVKNDEKKAKEAGDEYTITTTTWITAEGLILKQVVKHPDYTITSDLITENS